MKAVMFSGALLLITLCFAGCGTTGASSRYEDLVRVTGITEVLHAGTRSETVIITDDSTGEVFALVGELALDIVLEYGQQTSVTGRITQEGFSVREDLRKLNVTDYSIVGVEEPGNY